MLGIFLGGSSAFFQNQHFRKILSGIPSDCKNSLDPDQARLFVWPDLGPNCSQRFKADDTSRQRAKCQLLIQFFTSNSITTLISIVLTLN